MPRCTERRDPRKLRQGAHRGTTIRFRRAEHGGLTVMMDEGSGHADYLSAEEDLLRYASKLRCRAERIEETVREVRAMVAAFGARSEGSPPPARPQSG